MFTKEQQVILAMMMASFLTPFTVSSLNLSFPLMATEFGVGPSEVSWVVETFLIACTVCVIPAGRLAEIIGKRKIFYIGLIAFVACSYSIAMVDQWTNLLALRVLQGMAVAMVFTTSMAIVTLSTPRERLGRAYGWLGGTVYLGLTLGPVLGGFLNFYWGWRSVFFFIASVGVGALLLSLVSLKEEWTQDPNGRMDWIGCVLYAVSMIAIMTGLTEWVRHSWAPYVLGGGVFTFALLCKHQWQQSSPLIPLRLFTDNAEFALSNLAAMLNYSATFAVTFLMSLYLQVMLGYNSKEAGLVLMMQTLVMIALSPKAGALSDRYSPHRLAMYGMVICAVSLAIFGATLGWKDLTFIMANLAFMGVGFSFFGSPNNKVMMNAVGREHMGFASSMIHTVRLIGQSFSMAMVTVILSYSPMGQSGEGVLLHNLELAFYAFAVICGLGILPAFGTKAGRREV